MPFSFQSIKAHSYFLFAMMLALASHSYPFNGPEYWKVGWRSLDYIPIVAMFSLVFGLVLFLFSKVSRHKIVNKWSLAGMFFTSICLRFVSIFTDSRTKDVVASILNSEGTTSYFTDAEKIESVGHFMTNFHLLDLGMHSSTHPPGPVLFYYFFISNFGISDATFWIAICLNILLGMSPILFYFCAKNLLSIERRLKKGSHRFDTDKEENSNSLLAYKLSLLFCILPGFVFLFPSFDPLYAIFTMGMVLCWLKFLETQRYLFFVGFLILFLLMTLFGFHLLSIGTFFALTGVAFFLGKNDFNITQRSKTLLGSILILIIGTFFFYYLLEASTGYKLFPSLKRALSSEKELGLHATRPFYFTFFTDLYMFMFAIGFGYYFMIAPWVKHTFILAKEDFKSVLFSPIFCGFSTVLVVHFTGLLRAETERIWMFLVPFALIAAYQYVEKLNSKEFRGLVFLNFLVLIVLKANVTYLRTY